MLEAHSIAYHFSAAASAYDQHAELQQLVRRHAMKLAAHYWRGNELILDLGCGTGAFAAESRLARHRWNILGLDSAYGMCRRSSEQGFITLQADAEALPLANASFDGVFSSLMLQWCNRPAIALAELSRVLKAGAVAIVTIPVAGTLLELAQAFQAIDNAPHINAFMTPHTIMGYHELAGLRCLRFTQETITEYYPDTIALMRSLQAIGATNAHAKRRRGLMTPRQFARLEQGYAKYRTSRGLPATWQVLFMVLKKES